MKGCLFHVFYYSIYLFLLISTLRSNLQTLLRFSNFSVKYVPYPLQCALSWENPGQKHRGFARFSCDEIITCFLSLRCDLPVVKKYTPFSPVRKYPPLRATFIRGGRCSHTELVIVEVISVRKWTLVAGFPIQGFSQTHKIIINAKFVFPCICSFPL